MPRTLLVGDDADLLPSVAAALADPEATEIVLLPGRYVEHLVIAPRRAPLLLRSSTGRAEDVVLTFGLRQGDRDRTGMEFVQSCATLTVDADDVVIADVTIENSFDKRLHPALPNVQALALRTRGDRIRLERCRLVGQQDTVLLDAPSWAAERRVHLLDCEIEGDVDFVYGRATALIEGGRIVSTGPGYVAAPSTAREVARGFLFSGVELVSAGPDGAPLPDGSVHLGRPWHPGGKPDAVGQALFVRCWLGPHIAEAAWTEMGGFDWRDARLAEFENTGPGAATGDGRPQLDEAPDPRTWLRSDDPREPERLVVVSDSTAAAAGPDREPRSGWAEHLAELVGLPVENRAVSGASSGSFLASGFLDEALAALGPGDVLLIAFGHNDPKPDERFADVFTQYEANLRRYLVGARSRGAVPVLLTPVERRSFADGRARSTHGGYPERVRRLAEAEGVALVDLTASSRALWQQQGEEGSRASFLHLEPGAWPAHPDGESDDSHFSVQGARAVARLVADGLRATGVFGPAAEPRHIAVRGG